jgi:thioredoxin reductase
MHELTKKILDMPIMPSPQSRHAKAGNFCADQNEIEGMNKIIIVYLQKQADWLKNEKNKWALDGSDNRPLNELIYTAFGLAKYTKCHKKDCECDGDAIVKEDKRKTTAYAIQNHEIQIVDLQERVRSLELRQELTDKNKEGSSNRPLC